MATKIFISYSHHDSRMLDRLHTHLAVLKREGKIDSWYDRDIAVGEEVDIEIAQKLCEAKIFIALISPDFLASEYCYQKEMGEAIKRYERGEMRIISVILEPCEWKKTPLQRFKVVPRDGKPIADWANPNSAFLDVVSELRKVIERNKEESKEASSSPSVSKDLSSRKELRLKRDFDQFDRAEFRDEAYEIICSYFEKATQEINGVEGLRTRFTRLGPDAFTASVVNKGRARGMAHITVRRGGGMHTLGDIAFSWEENARVGSSNGMFTISHSDYELFLIGGDHSGGQRQEPLAPKDVAEQLWAQFIEQAGVTYA